MDLAAQILEMLASGGSLKGSQIPKQLGEVENAAVVIKELGDALQKAADILVRD